MEQQQDNQINLLLSDFNTRLRDVDERNRVVKERVLLLSQNVISSRDEFEKELEELKKDNILLKKEVEKLKSLSANILSETNKFVRKDEMLLIERMLKDFEPIEFVRESDVNDIIDKKIAEMVVHKRIKTKKTVKHKRG